jgi:hypothetical protein
VEERNVGVANTPKELHVADTCGLSDHSSSHAATQSSATAASSLDVGEALAAIQPVGVLTIHPGICPPRPSGTLGSATSV